MQVTILAGKHLVIQTEMCYFTNCYMVISDSEKGVGDGHQETFKVSIYITAHLTINTGLPSPGISQQLFFFSPDFGAVQKDFTVSEEVYPPTLSPVFHSV